VTQGASATQTHFYLFIYFFTVLGWDQGLAHAKCSTTVLQPPAAWSPAFNHIKWPLCHFIFPLVKE
jgi:hypothetical protein